MHSPNFARHRFLGVGSVVSAPDGSQSRALVRDTWRTDIVAELTPEPTDISLYKHRFRGFFETELDGVLQRPGAGVPDLAPPSKRIERSIEAFSR